MKKVCLFIIMLLATVILLSGCDFYALSWGNNDRGVSILMYHHLAPEGTYEEENGAVITVEQFEEQLAWLKENEYQTLFISELVELLQTDQPLPAKAVVITFDDGYESNYYYGLPLLKKYQAKATVNLVISASEKATTTVPYDAAVLNHLSLEELQEMRESGLIEFQSHTYNLHGLVNIDDLGNVGQATMSRRYFTLENRLESYDDYQARLLDDFTKANQFLRELGTETLVLAYPYGSYKDMVIYAARQSGSVAGLSLEKGLVVEETNLYTLPRIQIWPTDTMDDFVYKVTFGRDPR